MWLYNEQKLRGNISRVQRCPKKGRCRGGEKKTGSGAY